jgi:hypothetical protein
MNRVIKLNPLASEFAHPFMFEVACRSDTSAAEWFARWYAHIDTKTTYIEGAGVNDEFYREIRRFETDYHAHSFYESKIVGPEEDPDVWTCDSDYDGMDAAMFDS